jgi:hypothetical protein
MGPESGKKACKKFIDKTGKSSRERRKWRKLLNLNKSIHCGEASEQAVRKYGKSWKRMKGVWGMPWLLETTKDVVSCEKLRVGANSRLIRRCPNGATYAFEECMK